MLGISRIRTEKGFRYQYAGGKPIRRTSSSGRKLLDWIESLAIPPSWERVKISVKKQAKVLAHGRDTRGKKQYRYNKRFSARKQREKYDRIVSFAENLSKLRRITAKHLEADSLRREKVLACMVRMMELAHFRPGNEQYTKQNETYGLTTLRSKHLSVEGGELTFRYVGKSGKFQQRRVESERLAQVVQDLDDQPGYRIFKYYEGSTKRYVNSRDLNEYICHAMGEHYSAKDFRTWAGTYLAASFLNQMQSTKDPKEQARCIVKAVKKVAAELGNTPAVARANYIDPKIIRHFKEGTRIADIVGKKGFASFRADHAELNMSEAGVLYMLKHSD